MDKDSVKKLLFDKGAYYKDVTRKIRWLAILLVAVTYPLNSKFTPVIAGLLLSAIIYNSFWYWRWLANSRFFGSYISMNLVDNIFVLALIIFSGGIKSPYYALFALMAITAVYWYGYKGLSVLGLFNVIVAAGMITSVDTAIAPTGPVHTATIFIFIIMIAGILAERLTQVDRQERQNALKANREIESERQRLLALLNSMGDGVIALDRDGKTLLYNGATMELLNTHAELMNTPVADYLKLYYQDNKPFELQDLFKTKRGITRRKDLSFKSSDGSLINLDLTVSAINPIGGLQDIEGGFILIIKDITKEKTLDEARDEFLAVTSHELRTPIAVAEANLSTALQPAISSDAAKSKEMITKARDSVVFLGTLIEDLSVLAKVDRGILDVDLKMLPPAEIMTQLKDTFETEASAKGLQITTASSPGVHSVLTSPTHTYEVLRNFVSNAIKYSDKGKVELRAETSKTDGESIVFSVKDNGIGISASDKKKIFDKFFRSEDYRTRTTGGTGLGLYIAKKLADRLNGKLWFESELDKGSAFYLEVPPASRRKEDQTKVAVAQTDDFISNI